MTMNNTNKKLNDFDNDALTGLRSIAVLLVFNVHFMATYYQYDYYTDKDSFIYEMFRFFTFGHLGVDIFFVLSGFLIFYSIQKNNYSFFTFIKKRLFRILPVLFVLTLPYFPRYMSYDGFFVLFDNLIMLNIFGSKNINHVTWSLEYEMYFYILFGILLIVFKVNTIIKFIFLYVLLYALSYHVSFGPIHNVARFNTFILGVVLGALYFDKSRWDKYKVYFKFWYVYIMMLGASFYIFKLYNETMTSFEKDLFYSYVGFVVFLLLGSILDKGNIFSKFLSSKPNLFLGRISYSFYLFHSVYAIKLGGGY